MLSRERILGLFAELDDVLCRMSVRGDVFIVGGAAMTVAYDARPATRDVDGIWHPSTEVRRAAAQVAIRHDDLKPDWLNDAVNGVLPVQDRGHPTVVYDGECLTVSVPSPEYLLATKLLASRVGRDEDDILLLYRLCGLTTADQGLDLVERYYPGRPIEAKVRFYLEELLTGDRGSCRMPQGWEPVLPAVSHPAAGGRCRRAALAASPRWPASQRLAWTRR